MAEEWVFSPRYPFLSCGYHVIIAILAASITKLCRFYHCNFLSDFLKVILSPNMDLISQASVVVEDRSRYEDIIM